MGQKLVHASRVAVLALFAGRACLGGAAQTVLIDRNAVVIDPAHGGSDDGAPLNDRQEKDLTLALGLRLQALLVEKGFQVAMTRDADTNPGQPVQRAAFANRYHALACLVLHASASTSGVSIATSALGSSLMRAPDVHHGPGGVVPWDRAQEMYAAQSSRLANQVGTAIQRSGTPVTIVHAVVRPLDNLTCPALSVELGGLRVPGLDLPPIDDARFQQRTAEAIVNTLVLWRSRALWDGAR